MEKKRVVATCGIALITMARLLIKRRRKRIRRFKVRPINKNRSTEGAFATIVRDMKNAEFDKDQFTKYVRLSPQMFLSLMLLIGPSLVKDATKNPLSPFDNDITVSTTKVFSDSVMYNNSCCSYLAEGCSMQEIAWNFRVGKTTVHKIIKEMLTNIWNILMPIFLPQPSENTFRAIEVEFQKRWNVPNCVGAVDGKHITIQAPAHSGSTFFNYKKSFSIVLMAVCDAYYRFVFVDIGAEGSKHDSEVFRGSGFGSALLNMQAKLPPPKELPGTSIKLPHFIVGDSAFPLHENSMRPYPGDHLDSTKIIYNYRLSRGRRTIENTFGIISQRWRILRQPIVASVETSELIVQAIVALHNFAQCSEKDLLVSERKYCPMGFADHIDHLGNIHLGNWRQDGMGTIKNICRIGANNYAQNIRHNRDTLAEYFVSPNGSLPWQENYVLRGSLPRH